MFGAVGRTGAREEQAQVVMDFGDRADGRARIVTGRLLLDRDRRRQALDQIDVGLFHALQKLPGVGRQGLDIAPLPLGVERIEGERRLARTGKTRNHDQPVARQVEIDVLQIMRACAAYAYLSGLVHWLLAGGPWANLLIYAIPQSGSKFHVRLDHRPYEQQ